MTCHAAIADAQNKEKVWKDITDPKSTFSSEQKGALMEGFWVQDQLELVRPFFDRYFEIIPEIESQHGFKYLGMFCLDFYPTVEVQDKHIVKLANIKSKVPDTNKTFQNTLQNAIERCLRFKNIREYAN